MAALVLESSQFMSLGGTQGEASLRPPIWRPLTVVLSDRAVCVTAPQPQRRGAAPYVRRGGENNTSNVNGTRGTSSLSSIPSRHRPENEILVDAIFSAHSDGLMVILRKA